MQAIFNDAFNRDGVLIYSITYVDTDGTKTVREDIANQDITPDFLSQMAFNEVTKINAAKARKIAITVPSGYNIDIAEPPPPSIKPTQDEIDMNNYFEGKRVVLLLQGLIKVGRKEVTQQMLDNAIAAWNNMRLDPAWESITQDELNILLNGTP